MPVIEFLRVFNLDELKLRHFAKRQNTFECNAVRIAPLLDGRPGNSAPDHQRLGRRARLLFRGAVGTPARCAKYPFQENQHLRSGLRHMTRTDDDVDYSVDEV